MIFKSNGFKLGVAIVLGLLVMLVPRPEGTKFRIMGDGAQALLTDVSEQFTPGGGDR